ESWRREFRERKAPQQDHPCARARGDRRAGRRNASWLLLMIIRQWPDPAGEPGPKAIAIEFPRSDVVYQDTEFQDGLLHLIIVFGVLRARRPLELVEPRLYLALFRGRHAAHPRSAECRPS